MSPVPEVVQRRHRAVIGVDTHKYVHVAVALDEFGGVIDAQRFAADRAGYVPRQVGGRDQARSKLGTAGSATPV